MARRLSRLRPRLIRRDELAWRARVFARTGAQRIASSLRTPRWDRERLHDVLVKGVLDAAGDRAIASGNWAAVQDALITRLQERPARFVLNHRSADAMAARILSRWPGARAEAARRADRILAGRFDLLAYSDLSFAHGAERVDWHRDPAHDKRAPAIFWADVPYLNPKVVGDHKIIWELNRHQYWLQLGRALWLTGDPKYGRRIVEDLSSWLAANRPLQGINWASMLELGLRCISWTWGLHFLLGCQTSDFRLQASPWLVDMLVAIDRQLRHVEQNLSYYFSPNTHLTGEALALYVIGLALPELAGSRRWVERGRAILLHEIDRQILADGGHAERSTHYHRYTLDIYLLALVTALRADAEPVAQFTDAVGRLAEFARALADDRGCLPVIGDDDGGMLWPITGRDCRDVRDSLALAAAMLGRPRLAPWGLQEEVCWIGGDLVREEGVRSDSGGAAPQPLSRTFHDSGYIVTRDGRGNHAVFDAGPHGYMNGGHAHADALAVTIATAQGPLLIDPGTSSYTLDPRLRDRMRGSRNHNTVEIDGRAQSIPSGPFHWRTRTDARLHGQRHNPSFDWAEASHDGYGKVRHRRSLFRSSSGWLVVDEVLGTGAHAAAAFWHFDPEWSVTTEGPGRLRATHGSGASAWLLHDGASTRLARGDGRTGLGWCAPVYGALVSTWSAEITRREHAPFALVTWIGVHPSEPHLRGPAHVPSAGARRAGLLGPPSLEQLQTTSDSVGSAIAARIVDGDLTAVFLLRPGEPPFREGRAARALDYQTDARALHYESTESDLMTLALLDASHALGLSDGLLSVSADDPFSDLHIAVDGGVLDLHASEPPQRLTLQGAALDRIHTLRLNGSEITLAPVPTAARSLVINGHEWTAEQPMLIVRSADLH